MNLADWKQYAPFAWFCFPIMFSGPHADWGLAQSLTWDALTLLFAVTFGFVAGYVARKSFSRDCSAETARKDFVRPVAILVLVFAAIPSRDTPFLDQLIYGALSACVAMAVFPLGFRSRKIGPRPEHA